MVAERSVKSLHIGNIAGQANLRGKRSRLLRCGCCEVQDFRGLERAREALKEIAESREIMVQRDIDAHPWRAAHWMP